MQNDKQTLQYTVINNSLIGTVHLAHCKQRLILFSVRAYCFTTPT